jgi:4-hydroxy 2-oxovalerate aldolase
MNTSNAPFSIVDCTLRDGGYYTNWDFPDALVDTYLEAIRALPVRHVEIGYRAPRRASGYLGRYFFLDLETLKGIRARLRPDQGLAVMFNFKEVDADTVSELTADLPGTVDLVRFACPPEGIAACIELGRIIKARGIKVAINVMYLTKYADDVSVLAPLAGAGDVIDYVALVDSYGGVMPAQVSGIVRAAVELLPQPVGFHGHDNLSLAFANSLAALEAGATMLDATITGMGRGAGNLKTELIFVHREMVAPSGAQYGRLASAVDAFEALQREYQWGTNLAYMVSGAASLPQADVMNWLGTRRYQMGSIIEALRQDGASNLDTAEHPPLAGAAPVRDARGRPVIVIGGGESIARHAPALIAYARRSGAVFLHSSMRNAQAFAGWEGLQIFCLAGQEYTRLDAAQIALLEQENRLIVCPPPPRFQGAVPAKGPIYQSGAAQGGDSLRLGPVTDEPPLDLAIDAAMAIAPDRLYLAGFDGYASATLSQQQNARDVQAAIQRAQDPALPWGGRVQSLTPSLYDVDAVSVYAEIQIDRD